MLLPSVEQYALAVEKKDRSGFSFLDDYSFSPSTVEGYSFIHYTGSHGVLFQATKDSKNYAIRFFLEGEPEFFERWAVLADYLSSRQLPWKVDSEFLDKEVLIDGQRYPAVKMDWQEGLHLNQFIDTVLHDSFVLSKLQAKLVELSQSLENNGIGHGDLNYHHVLVEGNQEDFQLRLVGYDSVFIPSFAGSISHSPGTPGFQHPKKLATDFSETMDRFSVWILLTGLEALKHQPSLWKDGDAQSRERDTNFLFTVRDLIYPGQSKLFQKLRSFNQPALNFYTEKLIGFCQLTDLDRIDKPQIFREGAKQETALPIRTEEKAPPVESSFDVEIKTIPAGKDVLVHGVKKGITPLRLALSKKDFPHVAVSNGSALRPVGIREEVQSYEIDLSPRQNESIQTVTEKDKILDFRADKYYVTEDELVTLHWHVHGRGPVVLEPVGEVSEKRGTKKLVLNRTTEYTLRIGDQTESITITVEAANKKGEPVKEQNEKSSKGKKIVLLLGTALLAVISYFTINFISSDKVEMPEVRQTTSALSTDALSPKASPFTTKEVSSFLQHLYDAYNARNLGSIMSNYASSVDSYYDSRSITRDSLGHIINDLFIQPAYYSCHPDFKTLHIEAAKNSCKAVITIHEKLKSHPHEKTASYTTTIEYSLDPSYKIIAEKTIAH
ncbi:MAG: hypothetical protein ACJ75B_10315 [Flavisolibacter sp.]